MDPANGLVKSLAEHFLSGELSTELLRNGTDEEITKALIAVRGIGQVSTYQSLETTTLMNSGRSTCF